jgi:S-adenosyl-L-methionine hydrolase (adenosine-forming)
MAQDARMNRVTLLTDFGTVDGYVAAIKGVLASIVEDLPVDDASHEVVPGDVEAAAWALGRYWRLYPRGTVHLVVVDPGVGTARRALAVEADGRFVVAPDNGVLTRVLDEASTATLVTIENAAHMRHPVSRTFHGRDILAPAAAWLATGGGLSDLGPAIHDPVLLPIPLPIRRAGGVDGMVVHVDRFGNLITNIPADMVVGAVMVVVDGRDVGAPREAYGQVMPGDPLAIIGSAGMLEIAVRDGSAASLLGGGRGSMVRLEGAGNG